MSTRFNLSNDPLLHTTTFLSNKDSMSLLTTHRYNIRLFAQYKPRHLKVYTLAKLQALPDTIKSLSLCTTLISPMNLFLVGVELRRFYQLVTLEVISSGSDMIPIIFQNLPLSCTHLIYPYFWDSYIHYLPTHVTHLCLHNSIDHSLVPPHLTVHSTESSSSSNQKCIHCSL